MTPEQEKRFAEAFNMIFNRAQLDAIKATFTDHQKQIYNQTLSARKLEILSKMKDLSQTKLDEISRLFDEALL